MSFNRGANNSSENKEKWWCQAIESQKKSINGNSKIWSELVSLGLYVGAEKFGAAESVVWLVKEIPRNQNFQVYFDSWFSCAKKI